MWNIGKSRAAAFVLLTTLAGCVASDPDAAPQRADAAAAQPSFDPTPTLDDLQRRLERLERQHDFSSSAIAARRSVRDRCAQRLDASPTTITAVRVEGPARERLLDLQALEWSLRHACKYDPRTWEGSEQRLALLSQFDVQHPANLRQAPGGLRHHLDELRAQVFVLEKIHAE